LPQGHLEDYFDHAAEKKKRGDKSTGQKKPRKQKARERQNHQAPQMLDLLLANYLNSYSLLPGDWLIGNERLGFAHLRRRINQQNASAGRKKEHGPKEHPEPAKLWRTDQD